jgi:hypothetical protein
MLGKDLTIFIIFNMNYTQQNRDDILVNLQDEYEKRQIQEVNLSLVKLNQTVIGDKTYGQTGLIEKVEEHNAYIEKDKQFKSKLVGGGVVITFIWGFILKLLKF